MEEQRVGSGSQMEELLDKNKHLEEKIKENNEALKYWKYLNKTNVLAIREFRKEVNAYVETVDNKFAELVSEIKSNNSTIEEYKQKVKECNALVDRAKHFTQKQDLEIRIQNKKHLRVTRTKEHAVNCKVSNLETTVSKQDEEIAELKNTLGELQGIDKKYVTLDAKLALKEMVFEAKYSENECLKRKLQQKEEELKRKEEEKLEKDKLIQEKEEEFKKQIEQIKAENKILTRFANVFKKKNSDKKEVSGETKQEDRRSLRNWVFGIFLRKRSNGRHVEEKLLDAIIDTDTLLPTLYK